MVNERIALTSFMNRAVPAVARWKQRETEVLTSIPQPDYRPRNAELLHRHRPAAPLLLSPSSAPVPLTNSMIKELPSFREPLTIWRLVSGNHRELGRGLGTFTSEELAAEDAKPAIEHARRLGISFIRQAGTGAFGWYAGRGTRPLLLAPAWYGTPRECERSADLALQALQQATISAAVVKHTARYMRANTLDAGPELLVT